MAPTVPLGEPKSARAGDTWQWDQAYPTYPNDEGWTLSYQFRGALTLDTISTEVVVQGSGWRVTIPAARTSSLTPGAYSWTARVTGSGSYAGQVFTAGSGVLDVARNLATALDGEVDSNWAEKSLEVINNVLRGRITDDVQSYQIAGRAVTSIPLRELVALRNKLRREVYQAKHPGRPYVEHRVVMP